jgi:hypothetical protein
MTLTYKRPPPPSRELCLAMAKYSAESKSPNANLRVMEWLLCWAFYEHWIEEYWND